MCVCHLSLESNSVYELVILPFPVKKRWCGILDHESWHIVLLEIYASHVQERAPSKLHAGGKV